MSKAIEEFLEAWVLRVLNAGASVTPEEVLILPEMLKMLIEHKLKAKWNEALK